MSKNRIGVWLVGSRGGVASTAILGLAALQQGLVDSVGLVSELPQFQRLGLTNWDQCVVSGHEIRNVSLVEECRRMALESRIGLGAVVEQCREELEAIDSRVRPGTLLGVGDTIASMADWDVPRYETPLQAVARLGRDLTEFAATENLSHVVVVNVASTEPAIDASTLPTTWADMEKLLPPGPQSPLPASSLYAIAALEAGYSYINFTPSLGAAPAAIDELARLRGSRYYGCDGKTGETLLKSVLGPMFARRNLQVMSWVGHNIFGNMDGQVLDDPVNKQTKVVSKDRLLGEILGYKPKTVVSIEYVPDLGDWKTAWDHIHFAGFMGVPMTMQFTWQGCDSFLAAPLVLDLIRFTELAQRRGHVGSMPFLASFFKSPHGVTDHHFDRQFKMLEDWAAE